MGNHAKRKKAAALVRAHGFGRLYSGDKKVAWRMLSLDSIIRKLSFLPGSVAHDCDGFNHRVVEWLPEYYPFGRYRVGNGADGYVFHVAQFVKTDGSWSCGCPYSPDPARSRDEIEKYMLAWVTNDEMREQGWITEYHDRLGEQMKAGGHICDEEGLLLPEFRRVF